MEAERDEMAGSGDMRDFPCDEQAELRVERMPRALDRSAEGIHRKPRTGVLVAC
jgi:hypothetical protein